MTNVIDVPKTDAEVFEKFYPYVRYLVARMHIVNVEDVAMSLMEKFIAKGVLAQYDPEHESGANFKTFFSNFVTSYLRHIAKKERIQRDRFSASTDYMLTNDAGEQVPLMDLIVVEDADTEGVEVEELIANVRKALVDDPKLALFFEFVMIQTEDYGKMDADELADVFGVSRSSIYYWRGKLRKVFAQCM